MVNSLGNNRDIWTLTTDSVDLSQALKSYLPSEIVQLIEESEPEERLKIFLALDLKKAVACFEYLSSSVQKELLQSLPSEIAASILNEMAPDDRTAFLEDLPGAAVQELLKLLSPKELALTRLLLGYPENSVGRLMTTDYIAVKKDWTIQQSLNYIREHGKDSETINVIYVIDDAKHLLDDLRIRELLLTPPEKKISDIMNYRFVALYADDDREAVGDVFGKNRLVALPVLDRLGVLLGIVTLDDVLEVVKQEFSEDIQKFGGVSAIDQPYLNVPFFTLMKKRGGWLTVLFLGEMLTASAMAFFEDEIAKAVVLTLFVPLIISSGGNSGSQAATLVIRALALNELKLMDWWRVIRREVFSGLFLGTLLGIIGFLRIYIWTFFSDSYGQYWLPIGLTVGFALLGVVLWGTLVGSLLPMILQKLGFDPAVSSTPFIATLVDVTGLIIYFSVAVIFLTGTLL